MTVCTVKHYFLSIYILLDLCTNTFFVMANGQEVKEGLEAVPETCLGRQKYFHQHCCSEYWSLLEANKSYKDTKFNDMFENMLRL